MKYLTIILVCGLLLSGCSVSIGEPVPPTPTEPPFDTPTLRPTATETPTATPVTPTVSPTVIPVEGIVQTQVNVRTTADKNSPSLGMLKAADRVQIVGQTEAADWWLIYFADAPSGYGWVTAQYVTAKTKPEVPVVSGDFTLLAGTPFPTPTSIAGLSAKTLVKVNVRSGPGTAFNSLGMIDPETPVILTGKNETGTWLQIYKLGGPGDRGWVSSAYIRMDGDPALLPKFNEYGTPVVDTSGTPQAELPTPTPVIAPAADDGDSAQKPAASIEFSPSGARQFTYASSVSNPEGDGTDWVQFKPYSPQAGQAVPIRLSLDCEGNGTLEVELWKDTAPLSNWGSLACGSTSGALALSGDSTYLVKLMAAEGTGGLQSVNYLLTVKLDQ